MYGVGLHGVGLHVSGEGDGGAGGGLELVKGQAFVDVVRLSETNKYQHRLHNVKSNHIAVILCYPYLFRGGALGFLC